jgi:hypothetical protein
MQVRGRGAGRRRHLRRGLVHRQSYIGRGQRLPAGARVLRADGDEEFFPSTTIKYSVGDGQLPKGEFGRCVGAASACLGWLEGV